MTPGPATRILSPSAYVAWESEEPEHSEQGGRVAPQEKRCEGEDKHLSNSAADALDPVLSFFVWLHAHRWIMRRAANACRSSLSHLIPGSSDRSDSPRYNRESWGALLSRPVALSKDAGGKVNGSVARA